MKKSTSCFLTLTLILCLLLSGCNSSQADAQLSQSDSIATASTEAANTTAVESKAPVNTQSVDADIPSEEPSESQDMPDEELEPTDSTELTESAAPAQTPTPAPTQELAATPAPTQEAAAIPAPFLETVPEPTSEESAAPISSSNTTPSGTNLTLRFGGGESFTIHLYDNPTAAKIAEYVGTASWQLPIYHFDDYNGWESFQYYDIPSRYDIPSNAETITSEQAGMVYYSHPNRIILFYQNANISTEYTPVGYINFSQALVDAVENNPVVEGWGNKLIFIQP